MVNLLDSNGDDYIGNTGENESFGMWLSPSYKKENAISVKLEESI